MRITLSGSDIPVTDDTRAYAEYRLFSSVARHEPLVRAVAVGISHDHSRGQFLCRVTVDLRPAGRITTQARHPSWRAALGRASTRGVAHGSARPGARFILKSPPFNS